VNVVEIEEAIASLAAQPFDAIEFPLLFLAAFGNKETTLKGLRKCRFQYSLSFISALMSREGNKQLPTRHLSGQKLNFRSLCGFRTRGWRHPLLIKRMLATITPEI
jgi:hypothetical protein